jgi:hypothetical protein
VSWEAKSDGGGEIGGRKEHAEKRKESLLSFLEPARRLRDAVDTAN